MSKPSKHQVAFDQAVELSQLESEIEQLRRANITLQARLTKAKAKTDDLVAATIEAAHDAAISIGTKPLITIPKKDSRKAGEHVALWHLTDWQGGKRTPSYDSTVMVDRLTRFVDKARKLTEVQRATHPVKSCFIVFGGDMVEGLFNFPSQAHEIDQTLFGQYVTVSKAISDVVASALSIFEKVTVIPEWGNHGRIGSKRDGVPRPDNVDRMCYELAKSLLGDQPRLTWQDCPEDIQRIEIGNYRAIAIHGDEVGRNGFASPTTIVSHVSRWQSGAYPWTFRDCYIGHYHTHAEWPLPNGEGSVFQTGSTESENRYAGVMLAAQAIPSQRLHFIDPAAGRVTTTAKIWLDN